jgi:uncharacterized protein
MKKILSLLIIFTGFLMSPLSQAQVQARAASPKYPPHTIGNSELRVLPPAPNGRSYQLHVRLPGSYHQEPTKRYPVLYVTDAYWDFSNVVSSYDNLVYDKVLPEMIIIGLGYAGENLDYGKLRTGDLSPVAEKNMPKDAGHAAEFLVYMQKEIIPLMEREYRADPAFRALAGSSLGGLFTLYTMYTQPELFQGYVAVSPATPVGNDWLFTYAEKYAKSGAPIKGRLYMTGAENEFPGLLAAIKRFDVLISPHKYPGLSYQFRLIDGERHGGTKAEGYVRGMRYVFAPLAPETGPSK